MSGISADDRPLTVGTAGHVDHGKTTLVQTLTGVDTDRLPAEKTRGLSIELGFAPLVLPSGRSLSIVDVPGHERFIRTMVAGATGIDCFLMVVAATEGTMPQTHEHGRILHGLGVTAGLVAITKTDLADPAPAVAAARELFPHAPIVVCPAEAEHRRAEVLAALDRLVAALPGRSATTGPAVMHIDRVFTVVGAGTVVTGTLSSGSITRGESLVAQPHGYKVRVRGLEVFGVGTTMVTAGRRVAVNLARVRTGTLTRGDVLASPGAVTPAFVLDVRIGFDLSELPSAVHLHHGTRATPARVRGLSDPRSVRVSCRSPLIVREGDAIVVRDGARRLTLGGARVTGWRDGKRQRVMTPAAGPPAARRDAGTDARPPDPPALSPAAHALAARFEKAGILAPGDVELADEERRLLPLLCEHGDS